MDTQTIWCSDCWKAVCNARQTCSSASAKQFLELATHGLYETLLKQVNDAEELMDHAEASEHDHAALIREIRRTHGVADDKTLPRDEEIVCAAYYLAWRHLKDKGTVEAAPLKFSATWREKNGMASRLTRYDLREAPAALRSVFGGQTIVTAEDIGRLFDDDKQLETLLQSVSETAWEEFITQIETLPVLPVTHTLHFTPPPPMLLLLDYLGGASRKERP